MHILLTFLCVPGLFGHPVEYTCIYTSRPTCTTKRPFKAATASQCMFAKQHIDRGRDVAFKNWTKNTE